jgi:hypothetical protein
MDGVGSGVVTGGQVGAIRSRAAGTYDDLKAAAAKYAPAPTHPAWSGPMVPPLPPDLLTAVLAEMKRCGFKTVFYPALYDGYATFPTAAFPLSPDLNGTDGLARAAAAAKRNGIALVACVGTLSWRLPGDAKHWLDAHPDWLDRDVLGRTRLDWLASHPDFGLGFAGEPFLRTLAARDSVRPSGPEVKSRLIRIVEALAHRPGISGIAFADWKPAVGAPFAARTVPPLGFATPDRVAMLQATGWDPVDLSLPSPPFRPRAPSLGTSLDYSRAAGAPDPYQDLVNSLVAHANAGKADWTTYRVDITSLVPSRAAVPPPQGAQPDRVISTPSFMGDAPAVMLLPVPSRAQLAADHLPEEMQGLTPIQALHRPRLPELYGLDHARAIVYDFRACPEDILESLAWLYPKAVDKASKVLRPSSRRPSAPPRA